MTGSLITRRVTAYLPAVDGLRAIAIAAVFIYHAHTAWLPGGYLGVDLFFAISGFLITRALLQEHDERGAVDLKQFWLRRARRLLPAAFLFVFVIIAAALIFFPGDLRALRGVALAALAYGTNWYLIFSQQSYFDTIGRPQLFQHLWSLAVEEQFYLVWPPALILALRVMSRRAALGGTILLGVASVVLMAVLYRGGADASRLYYGTDTHAVGLLLGAALAFVEPTWRAYEQRLSVRSWRALAPEVAGVVALGVFAFLCVWLAEGRAFLYEGGFLLTALASLALIVPAAGRGWFAVVMGSGPFRWIGVRSYSIYLWHPAMLGLVGAAHLELPRAVVVGFAALATILVADISFRYVEQPIRSGTIWRTVADFQRLRWDTRWATIAASGAAVSAILVGTIAAPASTPPTYLAMSQISGVLTSNRTEAPSWVVPRDAVGGSAAEPVSRVVPGRSSTLASPASSLSAVLVTQAATAIASPEQATAPTATPTEAPAAMTAVTAPDGVVAPVLAIGDSVMLGAANGLAQAFGTIEVDAAIGRDVASTLRNLRERRATNRLPATVIVQLGNNGPITRPQIDDMMQTLADVQRVIVIDLHVPEPWELANNAMLADAVSRYPNARLAGWHAATEVQQPELFWDGIHLRPLGVRLYVGLIAAQAE